MTFLDWQGVVLPHARDIVESYDTGVTLRQLFYRLVADGTLPNIHHKYRYLSATTSDWRRAGTFPELLDRTSRIERHLAFDGARDAMDYLARVYRRDRTAGQPWSIYLGVEKAGLSTQLVSWFTDELGVPVVALGGYASQSLVKKVRRDIARQDRPSALIYAGDMDPTGEDIDRDFEERVGDFDKVIRVALFEDQVLELPHSVSPEVVDKLNRDPRAARFLREHRVFLDEHFGGEIVQFEVDALPPDRLRYLYQAAIEQFWNDDAHAATLAQERVELAELRR